VAEAAVKVAFPGGHSGHSRVGTSTGVSVRRRAISAFTGFTTRKKITAAMIRNEISALMKAP
jgi:hypothetical protein